MVELNKPVGLVYIGIKKGKKSLINKYYFKGKKKKLYKKLRLKKLLI